MFEHRVRILLTLFGCAGVVLLLRLAQLQLVQANEYRRRASAALIQQPQSLPFVRGRILDRHDRVLVSDEPCWHLTVDFAAIATDVEDDPVARKVLLRQWRHMHPELRGEKPEMIVKSLDDAFARSWTALARFASRRSLMSIRELREQTRAIYERIQSIRDVVAARRGFDAPVAEEYERHALLNALSDEEQIVARSEFAEFPWIHVEPSSVRQYDGDLTSLAHVLGRTSRVTAETVGDDSNKDDPFARYQADESVGITGVEWSAETTLRGRRGQVTLDRDGSIIEVETFAAEHGRDVQLTIDASLQDHLYEMLGDAVRAVPESSGGAIVVLDVMSREVRALVSYPSYDPSQFDELFPALRDDTERLPLWFRAVASRYAPGSTIKPLACLSGLMNDVVTVDTRETCTGYLFPENRTGWRCWQIHGTDLRKAHGSVDLVEALIGSCNIYMYRLGERLGVDRLCGTFDMIGVGRPSGIGLREEDLGINPTPGWLMAHKNMSATAGTARLYAMGQGELSMTPLQVANLMATYATGAYGEVRLVSNDRPQPMWTLPITRQQWLAIRRAMYGVVNSPEGTAYDFAHFVNDRFALLGKTGSATAAPWATAYRVTYESEDGTADTTVVRAGSRQSALELFHIQYPDASVRDNGVEIAEKWPATPPPSGDEHAHAWFGGFLQPLDATGAPDWDAAPRYAFAALVEFGGSGGRVSGPLAKRIAGVLVDYDLEGGRIAIAAPQGNNP